MNKKKFILLSKTMFKILLLFLIFVSISPSTIPTLYLGVETDFNNDSHEFEVDSSIIERPILVAYIDIEDKQLKINYSSIAEDKTIIKEMTIIHLEED